MIFLMSWYSIVDFPTRLRPVRTTACLYPSSRETDSKGLLWYAGARASLTVPVDHHSLNLSRSSFFMLESYDIPIINLLVFRDSHISHGALTEAGLPRAERFFLAQAGSVQFLPCIGPANNLCGLSTGCVGFAPNGFERWASRAPDAKRGGR